MASVKKPLSTLSEDSDLVSGAFQRAQKLDQERHNLLVAAEDMLRSAQALLKASDAFQLVCGTLTKPSDFSSITSGSRSMVSPSSGIKPPPPPGAGDMSDAHAAATKFMSEMQRFLAADTKSYAEYIKNGIMPLLEYLKSLNYEEFQSAKKTIKKKKVGAALFDDFAKEVEVAVANRDQRLYKLFSNLMSCKGKYLIETGRSYEKHKPIVESFTSKLKETSRESMVVGSSDLLIKRYPEGERLAGEGQILKIESVGCVSGPRYLAGMLTLTHYRVRLITFEEVDSSTGIVEKQSETIFDIPIACIAFVERIEPAKDELVTMHCKDLREFALSFKRSTQNADTFLGNLVPLISLEIEKSAFAYFSKEQYQNNGWYIYDAKREYTRLNIPDDYIRTVSVNADHSFSPTYPKLLVLPNSIKDSDIKASASYRSKSRVITICWRDVRSWQVIARCSQPLVGISKKRNPADEMIIKAIGEWAESTNEHKFYGVGADGKPLNPVAIFDARPKVNAIGNRAGGGGYEDTEELNADLSFLNIENIHVVREGLKALRSLFSKTEDINAIGVNTISDKDSVAFWSEKYFYIWNTVRRSTQNTSWFPMLQTIIAGAVAIVEALKNGRSVIVHCSDGWDRTPQVTSIAQMMLDGYHRTIVGFMVLIEKEWISFGHKFGERYGHGKNRAKYQDKQRSPIFIQWLDAVYQIISQYPEAFEFDYKLLVFLAEHVYSCRFGTFLYDTESERDKHEVSERTVSIWSYVLDNFDQFVNPDYERAPSPLKINSTSKNFQLWIEYYIRWDQTFFKNPTSDAEKIVDHFQKNYARPTLFMRPKMAKAAGINISRLASPIPSAIPSPNHSRVPSAASTLPGSVIKFDENETPDFTNLYEELTRKINETESKSFEADDE